jgi:anaerobic C4-dicarboxylate transporter
MKMSLKEWVENGWLTEIKVRKKEIQDILDSADFNLKESKERTHSSNWKFLIAYIAIINYADAALRACGYRTKVSSHHYYVIQSLSLTIGLEPELIDLIDSFRKKRHTGTYEKTGTISRQDVKEILNIADTLRYKVIKWLKEKHNDLLK